MCALVPGTASAGALTTYIKQPGARRTYPEKRKAEVTCAALLGKVSAGALTACIKQQQARRKSRPNLSAQSLCALQRRQEKQTACMKAGANAAHSSQNHAVLQRKLCSMHLCLERRRLAMRPPTSSMMHAHKLDLINVRVHCIAQPP